MCARPASVRCAKRTLGEERDDHRGTCGYRGSPTRSTSRSKAPIGPQSVESGFDIEQRHLPVPCVNRLDEPFQGSISLGKADAQFAVAHAMSGDGANDADARRSSASKVSSSP